MRFNREYKSTIFTSLFSLKTNMLSLYNALNGTDYTDTDLLEIRTIENGTGVFVRYRNDLSFLIEGSINFYEHMSTAPPNVPVRYLLYYVTELRRSLNKRDLYKSTAIEIPFPRFLVFYNGKTARPDKEVLRLSEQMTKQDEAPSLELIVTVYNVNSGHNPELLAACEALRQYAEFVHRMRTRVDPVPDVSDERYAAAKAVILDCIEDGVLSEFLSEHMDEVIEMYFWEYDEEADKAAQKEEREELEQEKNRLKAETDKLSAEKDKLSAENAEVKAENAEVKAENAEMKAENAEMKAENAEMKAENAEIKGQLENSAKKIMQLQKELEELRKMHETA